MLASPAAALGRFVGGMLGVLTVVVLLLVVVLVRLQEAPKRAMSAFLHFSKLMRPQIRSESGNINNQGAACVGCAGALALSGTDRYRGLLCVVLQT
jgi:hypothetical protein